MIEVYFICFLTKIIDFTIKNDDRGHIIEKPCPDPCQLLAAGLASK